MQATGMVASIIRGSDGSTPAPHSAATPVFAPLASNSLFFCDKTSCLQLLSMRLGNPPVESFTDASALVELAPMTRDAFGNYARWDPPSGQIMAGGSGPGEESIFTAPTGQTVTDLAMGYDGILYVALSDATMHGSLVFIDRRGRWPHP